MRWKRAAGWAAAALLVVAVLWFAGVGVWATRRLAEADRKWAATFGSLEDLRKKYPKVETNEVAKRVEELAKAAGFDLRATGPPTSGLSQSPADKAAADGREAVSEWINTQLERPDPSLESPPQAARDFLQERSETFAALEEVLLAGIRPQWALDKKSPAGERDTYEWAYYVWLQKALIGRALLAASEAQHAAGERTLEASWILREARSQRPDTLVQFLGIAVARLQVGALRKVDVEHEAWRQRLEALKPRSAMIDSIVLSELQILRKLREGGENLLSETEPNTGARRVFEFVLRPWYRLGGTDYSEALRAELAMLRDAPLSDRPSEEPPFGPARTTRELIANAILSTRNALSRADRLVVDAELTSKILEVKELRKKNGGRWPSAVPGIETCSFPGASWRYEVSPEGRMSIHLDRELASPYPRASLANPLFYSSN